MNKLRVAGIQAEPLNLHFEQVFEVGVDEVRATCSAAGVRGGWLAGGCPCRCRCRSEALPAAPTSPACTAATASTTEAVHLFAIPLQMSWDDLSKVCFDPENAYFTTVGSAAASAGPARCAGR